MIVSQASTVADGSCEVKILCNLDQKRCAALTAYPVDNMAEENRNWYIQRSSNSLIRFESGTRLLPSFTSMTTFCNNNKVDDDGDRLGRNVVIKIIMIIRYSITIIVIDPRSCSSFLYRTPLPNSGRTASGVINRKEWQSCVGGLWLLTNLSDQERIWSRLEISHSYLPYIRQCFLDPVLGPLLRGPK